MSQDARWREMDALRARLAAADALAEACERFRLEMENPVPDAIYRNLLLSELFAKAAAYNATRKEGGQR